jgi:hypothetical protein
VRETDARLLENIATRQNPAFTATTATAIPLVMAEFLATVGVFERSANTHLQSSKIFLDSLDV